MKIKLIYPPSIGITALNSMALKTLPYGIGTLTAFLRKNNIAVDQTDIDVLLRSSYLSNPKLQRLYRDLHGLYYNQIHAGYYTGISNGASNSVAERLLDLVSITESYMLAGISITGYNQVLSALLLAEKIKKEYKKPIVIGGPYVTAFAHLFFKQYDFIDYAVVGEGEVPLLKLIRSIGREEELQGVPSLWYRNGSQALFTGRNLYDIEDQSCPDFDGLPLELYRSLKTEDKLLITYSLSRGCTNKCNFCLYGNIDGPWQTKSVEKAIRDIAFLKEKYRSDFFLFEDTNSNLSYKHTEDFCDGLINAGLNINWAARGQFKNTDKKLLTKIKRAGCFYFQWGAESGSKKILHAMDKELDITEELNILKMAQEVGIRNGLTLIVGYPYETVDDLKDTALLLKNNAEIIDDVYVFFLVLFSGSNIFNNPQRARIKIKEQSHSFFTYVYAFQETHRKGSVRGRGELRHWQKKIFSYNLKYIVSKRFNFPYNVLLRLFDLELFAPAMYLLKKAYLKQGFYRFFHIKIIMLKFQYLAIYLPMKYLGKIN